MANAADAGSKLPSTGTGPGRDFSGWLLLAVSFALVSIAFMIRMDHRKPRS